MIETLAHHLIVSGLFASQEDKDSILLIKLIKKFSIVVS